MLYYITSAVARAHPTVAVAEAGQDSKAEPYVNLAQYLLQEGGCYNRLHHPGQANNHL